jgi:hypothetical protein
LEFTDSEDFREKAIVDALPRDFLTDIALHYCEKAVLDMVTLGAVGIMSMEVKDGMTASTEWLIL